MTDLPSRLAALTRALPSPADPHHAASLLALLRRLYDVGREDLPLGRLFEGHVDAAQIVKLPAALEFERAAGLTVTYGTTLYALRERGQLQPGETLAVLGAAGGTGLAAVELGKAMGARVIACASSDDKLAFARKHGRSRLADAFGRSGNDSHLALETQIHVALLCVRVSIRN